MKQHIIKLVKRHVADRVYSNWLSIDEVAKMGTDVLDFSHRDMRADFKATTCGRHNSSVLHVKQGQMGILWHWHYRPESKPTQFIFVPESAALPTDAMAQKEFKDTLAEFSHQVGDIDNAGQVKTGWFISFALRRLLAPYKLTEFNVFGFPSPE